MYNLFWRPRQLASVKMTPYGSIFIFLIEWKLQNDENVVHSYHSLNTFPNVMSILGSQWLKRKNHVFRW